MIENKDRKVVPRLRDFATTVALGELRSPVHKQPAPAESDIDYLLAKTYREWRNARTLWHAADLLNVAEVAGVANNYLDAARFVLESRGDAPKTLVRLALKISRTEEIPTNPKTEDSPDDQIRYTRRRLGVENRNAILWADLARLYVSIAKKESASRAMYTAVTLAPTNRFILRSAARLFLHVKDHGTSLRLLRASPSVVIRDPWLAAAEISISSAVGLPSAFAKSALELAANDSYSEFSRTELQSALATLEMDNGKNGKARKLFRKSLANPNENALAQAEFAERELRGIDIDKSNLNVALSYEANGYSCFNGQEWRQATEYGTKWLHDQPFSTRPAIFASYISSCILEDYNFSEVILRESLAANPNSPQIINNLVFALASLGKLDEAHKMIRKVDVSTVEPLYRITLTATDGMLKMRSGHVEAGRLQYLEAINLAKKIGEAKYTTLAIGYLAREEHIAGLPALETLRSAIESAGDHPDPDVAAVLENIATQIEKKKFPKTVAL